MKTVERQGETYQRLLKQAERSPIQISFRGVDDKDRPLYEVKNRAGDMICSLGTELEISKALEAMQS